MTNQLPTKSSITNAQNVVTNGRNKYLDILESAWQEHLKPKAQDAPTVISTNVFQCSAEQATNDFYRRAGGFRHSAESPGSNDRAICGIRCIKRNRRFRTGGTEGVSFKAEKVGANEEWQ